MSGEQLEPGTLLNDRYRILRVIGKGGMGTVYQAEHVRLDTILAVKEVRAPKMADADSARSRFRKRLPASARSAWTTDSWQP